MDNKTQITQTQINKVKSTLDYNVKLLADLNRKHSGNFLIYEEQFGSYLIKRSNQLKGRIKELEEELKKMGVR